MAYAKLFSSITESSLWSEQKEVRLLFVSMLARADQTGFVEASLPGLAKLANLTLAEVETAIEVLEAPDKHSKNPEFDGRRVAKVPGGWMLLNYEGYRNRRSEEDRREYMRRYMQDYRKQQSLQSANSKHAVNSVNPRKPPLAQAEAEAEAFNTCSTDVERATEESSKKTRPSRRHSYSRDFEAFWRIYPRRIGKDRAQREFDSAVRRVCQAHEIDRAAAIEGILEAAGDFAKQSAATEPRFIAHPSTWLAQGRYEDEEAAT